MPPHKLSEAAIAHAALLDLAHKLRIAHEHHAVPQMFNSVNRRAASALADYDAAEKIYAARVAVGCAINDLAMEIETPEMAA